MTIADEQRDNLEKVIPWAKVIREHLQPVIDAHRGKVHFRPSAGSISMVGLTVERPQRGRSGIRNAKKLAANFEAEFAQHCVDIDQRQAPDGTGLRAWLISEAYKHDRQMESLAAALATGTDLVFVTDEIALPTADGRIVCDLLAIRQSEGKTIPVVIELKSERQLTRLVEQVGDFASLVDEHVPQFEKLFAATLGRPVKLDGPCERWIVWPKVAETPDPQPQDVAAAHVRVVSYEKQGDGFVFSAGDAPS